MNKEILTTENNNKKREWKEWSISQMYDFIPSFNHNDDDEIIFRSKTVTNATATFIWDDFRFKKLLPFTINESFELFAYFQKKDLDTHIVFKYQDIIYDFMIKENDSDDFIEINCFEFEFVDGAWEWFVLSTANESTNYEIKKMMSIIEFYLFKVDTNRIERLVDGKRIEFDNRLKLIKLNFKFM